MNNSDMPKLYTIEEARALVPRLRLLLTAIREEKRELADVAQALEELTPAMRANGHGAIATRHELRMTELAESIRDKVRELSALDIELKDIETGLIDFLSLRDGEIIYLCWQLDEPTVQYWHHLDTGYAGRQPLDE